MTKKERLDLAQWVMEYATKSGASEAAVSIRNQRDIEVQYRARKLEKLQESSQNSLSLSIYVDNKYSVNNSNDLRKDALKPFIEEAVASTRYLSKDEFRSLPDPKFYPKEKGADLNILDQRYEKVETADRVKMAAAIEETALAQSDQIISVTTGYSDTFTELVRVHSNGFKGESSGTMFSAGAEATVKDESGGRPEDWSYATVRFYNDLPKPEIMGKDAVQRALRKVGQKKIESGKYLMIVENRSMGRLLGMLQGPMSGRSLQQKSSYLDGMLGKKIASEKLTITDDPWLTKGLGSRYFDGEGLAAVRRVIVEKGVLRSFFIDDYYGRKLKMEPNSGSTSNVLFELGDKTLDGLIGAAPKAILITSFIGGNSNPTTGDFSFGIIGQYIENGKIVQPVNEMNISGNQKEFWNTLLEVGKDEYPYSSQRCPSMVFEGVQFSGL